MARKGRDTLKLFFQRGALPSADHFGDFIDSTVNQVDDVQNVLVTAGTAVPTSALILSQPD